MWYKLNISRLVELLTPTFLRQQRHLEWLEALHFPLQQIVHWHKKYREQNLYRIQITSQVCYVRRALNDFFDPEQRRIQIREANEFKPIFIYTRAEKKPLFLGNIFLHSKENYQHSGVDFRVIVPKELAFNPHQMEALIDFYKTASKRYIIQIEK